VVHWPRVHAAYLQSFGGKGERERRPIHVLREGFHVVSDDDHRYRPCTHDLFIRKIILVVQDGGLPCELPRLKIANSTGNMFPHIQTHTLVRVVADEMNTLP